MKFLMLDTATEICSVALAIDNHIDLVEEKGLAIHSKKLASFIKELLDKKELRVSDLDAVSIGKGPGSYTGLRIGVSMAKGLCFGSKIPLISINTLKILSAVAIEKMNGEEAFYCPMLDARRMEVYTSLFDNKLTTLEEISAEIIDEHFYSNYLKENKIFFFGNGASKTKKLLEYHENAVFLDNINISAKNMISITLSKFLKKDFENVSLFEPFYLKEFVIKPSTKIKKILNQ